MKPLETRVTDGARTRDSWSHNPLSKEGYQRVSSLRRLCAGLQNRSGLHVVAPGAESRSASRHRARRAAGSCYNCGAEARPQRTRCYPCARKQAEYARRAWPRRKVAT